MGRGPPQCQNSPERNRMRRKTEMGGERGRKKRGGFGIGAA